MTLCEAGAPIKNDLVHNDEFKPTVCRIYLERQEELLASVEEGLHQAARAIDGGAVGDSGGPPLEPTPRFSLVDPSQSNVEFLPLAAVRESNWSEVYRLSDLNRLHLEGDLLHLLGNRQELDYYSQGLVDVDHYDQALQADWWVLYDNPEPCISSSSDQVQAWIVRPEDRAVLRAVSRPCVDWQQDRINVCAALAEASSGTFACDR